MPNNDMAVIIEADTLEPRLKRGTKLHFRGESLKPGDLALCESHEGVLFLVEVKEDFESSQYRMAARAFLIQPR